MQEDNKRLFKKKLIISLLIFAVSYVLFLILWLNIQDYYGRGILSIASHITAKVKNVDFEDIKTKEGGQTGAQFYILRGNKPLRIIFNFDFHLFTYNAPLTFAIMAALSLFITRHLRAYIEVLIILFAIHFFYVFTSEAGRLSYVMAKNQLESASGFGLFIWQYTWGFIDAMFIRFEPFLIGIYLYIRFSPYSFLKKKVAK